MGLPYSHFAFEADRNLLSATAELVSRLRRMKDVLLEQLISTSAF